MTEHELLTQLNQLEKNKRKSLGNCREREIDDIQADFNLYKSKLPPNILTAPFTKYTEFFSSFDITRLRYMSMQEVSYLLSEFLAKKAQMDRQHRIVDSSYELECESIEGPSVPSVTFNEESTEIKFGNETLIWNSHLVLSARQNRLLGKALKRYKKTLKAMRKRIE